MRNVCAITALLTALITVSPVVLADQYPALAPGLQERLDQVSPAGSDSVIDVVVFLERQKPIKLDKIVSQNVGKRSQLIKVVNRQLNIGPAESARPVIDLLMQHSTTTPVRLRIVPGFTARLPLAMVDKISRMDGVRLVVEDAPLSFNAPVSVKSDFAPTASSVNQPLRQLNVPALWQLGITGVGRLVCSFDTGVDGEHPALSNRWRGNHADLEACWFSKVRQDEPPTDRSGHGTHTMGIMVGEVDGDSIGVAPGAEWISAGVIDQGRPLQTTLSDIVEAFEWSLNPDGDTSTTDDVPDVISNSWGVPQGLFEPCDETFNEIIQIVEAAGIVTIFAAGNEGPQPMTLRSPADWGGTPAVAFSVGAVDQDNLIGAFSSRGPSSCDGITVKPEVVAPGVAIRSCTKDGAYAYMQGTSQAAPFVAGLVALMRQYNPEVTVDQIKYALTQAAVDLGPAGKDNAYGYGLVDAARLLDYLPAPGIPQFELVRTEFDGTLVWPGDTILLRATVSNIGANIPAVSGSLTVSDNALAQVISGDAGFYFGAGGVLAVNFEAFHIAFDPYLPHGTPVDFELTLYLADGTILANLPFEITVGIQPDGVVLDHGTSQIDFSVSDFAQYGLGPGSIYPAGGQGFSVDGGENLLYEAGIVIGRNDLQLSHSLRSDVGTMRPSDFLAVKQWGDFQYATDGGTHAVSELSDHYAEIPIPVTLTQDIITYQEEPGFLVFKYFVKNNSLENLTGLRFGFLADFDLSGPADQFVYDEEAGLMYQNSGEGTVVGLVPLAQISGMQPVANGEQKLGLDKARLYDLITNDGILDNGNIEQDMMFLVNSPEKDLPPGAYFELAFALVAADNMTALFAAADRARSKYDLSTDVHDIYTNILPTSFTLHQNYPNPFNPTTNIAFDLTRTSHVRLDVFNMLGQCVETLVDETRPAGSHEVNWDGNNANGSRVASGVYFYRLTTDESSQSRKMVLLK